MNNQFMDALNVLEKEKGVDREVLLEAIEAAIISGYKRNFQSAQNVRVDINRDNGNVKVFSLMTIVEEVEDPQTEITIEEAHEINPEYIIGDVVELEVTPNDFGRIAAQTTKQVITQRIREAERAAVYDTFIDKEEDIVTGIVQRVDSRFIYVDLGKTEGLLPVKETMASERIQQGDRIKVYISKVERTTKGPQILLSRTHPGLLKRLFELEVPEIYDGVVEIKAVAREAGHRSKIALYSNKEEVDAVGAGVGPRGARVQTIVGELKGEKIDIVKWSEEAETFIANSLSPSKVISVNLNEEEKTAVVIVPDYQLSLAIGKEGQNARLAAKLTGWKIDIKSESQLIEPSIEEETEIEDEAIFEDEVISEEIEISEQGAISEEEIMTEEE